MSEADEGAEALPGSEWFWSLVEQGRQSRQTMAKVLETLSREDLVRFAHEFKLARLEISYEPYNEHCWDCSEDRMADIAGWVVSRGRDFYADVFSNPERFPCQLSGETDERLASESFYSLAHNIHWHRYQEPIS